MYNYLIHPQAPLVFKSGRPFGAGGRDGANFPWPSAIAGMFRTCVMQRNNWDYVDDGRKTALLSLTSQGPFLVQIKENKYELLVPRPLDSLYLLVQKTVEKQICRLIPRALPDGSQCHRPDNMPDDLLFAQLSESRKDKPQTGPDFWPLSTVLAWQRGEKVDFDSLPSQGLTIDERTHTAIDPNTYIAQDSSLFQVHGLDFSPCYEKEHRKFSAVSFALAGRFSEDIPERVITLGGKRRISWLEKSRQDLFACAPEHLRIIAEKRGLVLTVITPALFAEGWRPGWLNKNLIGSPPGCEELTLKLRSACVGRWQGLSGWDLKEQKPKPSRKAVPAGSVYWFEIIGSQDFVWEKLWFASICDDAQDRRDGFGQVVPGPWQY